PSCAPSGIASHTPRCSAPWWWLSTCAKSLPPTRKVGSPQASFSVVPGNARQISRRRSIGSAAPRPRPAGDFVPRFFTAGRIGGASFLEQYVGRTGAPLTGRAFLRTVMAMSGAARSRAGQVQTVLGAVAPDAIGITLPHEHLLIDFKVMFAEPAAASDKGRAWEPVTMANLGWVRQHFNANLDNLRLTDEQVAIDEIRLFQRAGGVTVVDPTPVTLARDPLALARIARVTGLNVVMGSGYYVAASHPPD